MKRTAIAAALLSLSAGSALAFVPPPAVTWVDWVNADANSVKGTLALGSGVDVLYSGPIDVVELAGASWWTVGDAYNVTGAPDKNDIIRIVGGTQAQYKVSFLTPVVDPYMAILSLGQGGVPVGYQFDQTPTLVSSGQGWWGGCGGCLTVSGNTVNGVEGHGVVKFVGTFSELTWTVPNREYWHGFTVGAVGAVPEPETYALMLAGLAAVGAAARRRRA